MEQKLRLGVFMLLIRVSLAAWQRVTVIKGQAVHLSCPITNAHQTAVEWKDPRGYIIFFSRIKAIKDKRYSIVKLSRSEFTISISNVTFKDGGTYTCYQYSTRPTKTKVELTVVGLPKIKVTKYEGNIAIKCTAKGNHHPPQIFWKFDHGPEILTWAQVQHEDDKYVSADILLVRSVEGRVTVKCIVRHPALHSQALMNFVKIGRDRTKSRGTTTTSSPTARPEGPHFSITADSTTSASSNSTRMRNDTSSNATSTTGWIAVSGTTEDTPYNRTEGNRTGSSSDTKMQTRTEERSSLLVFLVTCLIFCLLVVVIFFAVKLRRAHTLWKKENEESDPSEESSKSKSSQEEKNSQGQRRRGIFNTTFTKYVVNEPTVVTSVTNGAAVAATESPNEERTSQPQTLGDTSARCNIKETEL